MTETLDQIALRVNRSMDKREAIGNFEGFCVEFSRRLVAELNKQEPSAWQPIETAPKDGSHVQLYRPEIQFVGYYSGADYGWRINAPFPIPTHWMPLPVAPTPPKEK